MVDKERLKAVRSHFKQVCKSLDVNPKDVEIRLLQNWTDRVYEILIWSKALGEYNIKRKGRRNMPPKRKPRAKTSNKEKTEKAQAEETSELGSSKEALSNIDFSSLGNLSLGEVSPTVSEEDVVKTLQKKESKSATAVADPEPTEFQFTLKAQLAKIEDALTTLVAQVDSLTFNVEAVEKNQHGTQKLVRDLGTQLETKLGSEIAQVVKKLDDIKAGQPVQVTTESLQEKTGPVAYTEKRDEEKKKKSTKKPKAKKASSKVKKKEDPAIPPEAGEKIVQFVKTSVSGDVDASDFSVALGQRMGLDGETIFDFLMGEKLVNKKTNLLVV